MPASQPPARPCRPRRGQCRTSALEPSRRRFRASDGLARDVPLPGTGRGQGGIDAARAPHCFRAAVPLAVDRGARWPGPFCRVRVGGGSDATSLRQSVCAPMGGAVGVGPMPIRVFLVDTRVEGPLLLAALIESHRSVRPDPWRLLPSEPGAQYALAAAVFTVGEEVAFARLHPSLAGRPSARRSRRPRRWGGEPHSGRDTPADRSVSPFTRRDRSC